MQLYPLTVMPNALDPRQSQRMSNWKFQRFYITKERDKHLVPVEQEEGQ